jgi:hypothetical protein
MHMGTCVAKARSDETTDSKPSVWPHFPGVLVLERRTWQPCIRSSCAKTSDFVATNATLFRWMLVFAGLVASPNVNQH